MTPAEAIKDAGGFVTTLGVIGPFTCGCCERQRPNGEYVGGVWIKGEGGELIRHILVCAECFNRHSGRQGGSG